MDEEAASERLWIEQARHDPQAFKPLYDRYFPRVYAYVRYRVGSTQDAEDLVAETFLKVAAGMESFGWQHEHSFAAWIFRIAHNLTSNFHRRNGRHPEGMPFEQAADCQARGTPPDEMAIREEQFAVLCRLISSLPEQRWAVITLRFFGGLRNQEIAAVLNLDERTVASHLCRAFNELQRRYLTEYTGARQEPTS